MEGSPVVFSLPLGLELLKDLALGVVSDDARVDEAAQIELLCPKHRHLCEIQALDFLFFSPLGLILFLFVRRWALSL